MLRTSRPCAVTTSGASSFEAKNPDGTRKCAQTTSGREASRTRLPSSRNRRFPPARRSSTARSISCPRSRSARSSWATNVPRSGSSGPGYICETSRIRMEKTLSGAVEGARAVVLAPLAAKHAADLTDRAACAQRVPHRHEQILGTRRRAAHARKRSFCLGRIARRPYLGGALELAALGRRVDLLELDRLLRLGNVRVDADDRALATLDLELPPERSLLDLALHVSLLDSVDGAAEAVDVLDQLPRTRLELAGERLDVERAAERVGSRCRARLALEDLLRAQRDRRRAFRRQRERLVVGVRVQRLRTAADRRQRLNRDQDDVVLRLLRRQRRAACLRVETEREGLRISGAEPLTHDPRPQTARRAELCDLLEEVVVGVEEEREPRAELVGREARLDRGRAVRDAVRERKRELLHGRRPRF